ncbi:MAG: PaaI family thioesterase [Lachnospiraceae bacterium]|nr:PaaI family thioesterase [Lachnospiraceae bacterium]
MTVEEINQLHKKQQGFIAKTGIRITDLGEGHAKGRVILDASCNNPMDYVHGGCLFTLADTVAGHAAMTYGGVVTTSSAEIHYLNPAKDTEYIEAEANVIRNGRTISLFDVMIRDDKGTEICKLILTYFRIGEQ